MMAVKSDAKWWDYPIEIDYFTTLNIACCIVQASDFRKVQEVGFEPTNLLRPELKSGAVDQAWQPLHPLVHASHPSMWRLMDYFWKSLECEYWGVVNSCENDADYILRTMNPLTDRWHGVAVEQTTSTHAAAPRISLVSLFLVAVMISTLLAHLTP